MLIMDFFVALAIAVLLTLVFSAFGRRGPWEAFWIFFVILLLFTWVGGVWAAPYGPAIWGVYWMPFLFFGLLIALIFAAVSPPPPRQGRRGAQAEVEPAAVVALDIFFWVMLFLLVAALFAYYLG